DDGLTDTLVRYRPFGTLMVRLRQNRWAEPTGKGLSSLRDLFKRIDLTVRKDVKRNSILDSKSL
ncbi:MAG: hypothetical protein AAF802_27360, partial [Planctomycetota bacterium]